MTKYYIGKDPNGVLNLDLATDTVAGLVKLNDATNSTSGANSGVAATPKAVKVAYDEAVAAKNVADAAFPKAGGKLTGSVQEHIIGLEGTSVTMDLTVSNNFIHVVTGATTFTITAKDDSGFQLGTLILYNGGAYTITWPSSFRWADGTPPSLVSSGADVITFFTADKGGQFYAAQVMTGIV